MRVEGLRMQKERREACTGAYPQRTPESGVERTVAARESIRNPDDRLVPGGASLGIQVLADGVAALIDRRVHRVVVETLVERLLEVDPPPRARLEASTLQGLRHESSTPRLESDRP
jgi:hypothetical protein